MPENITFINPENSQQIKISKKNILKKIIISDLEEGSRDFILEVVVEGENSQVEISGKAEAKNTDHKNWKISVVLAGKNQKGVLNLRGIADEKGKITFDGGGIIQKNSSGGDMDVTEKIVLFSKHAKAKNVPVLRVETEDLSSANHSASIAPFEKEIFFFLESRGISKEDGKKLLREGFLDISSKDED